MTLYFLPILVGFIGAVFASFLLNVAMRTHNGLDVIWGRSKCEFCKYPIPWYDNIPLVSYLLLGGRCRKCKNFYSIKYFLTEISAFFIFLTLFLVISYMNFGIYESIYIFKIVIILFYFSLYDILYFEIQDKFIIPIIILLIIFSGITFEVSVFQVSGADRLLGGFILALIFLIIIYFSNGKMGGGEIRLGALIGLILGFQKFYFAFLIGIFLATVSGILIGFINKLLIKGYDIPIFKTKIPLVPFMAIGVVFELFFKFTFNSFIYSHY